MIVSNISELHWRADLHRARGGSADDIGRLLEPYRKYLKTLARVQISKSLRGASDPSDMVQETFLRAYKAFGSFRGGTEAELLGWLRAVLASRLAERVRRELTRPVVTDLDRVIAHDVEQSSHLLRAALVEPGLSPSAAASQRETAVVVARAIEDLRPDYRTIILLRNLEGRPYAEIAAIMGRSVGSVKKLWVRALAHLQRTLEDQA